MDEELKRRIENAIPHLNEAIQFMGDPRGELGEEISDLEYMVRSLEKQINTPES